MARPQAILLLGPTGSGKTPLGELLARRGLWGRACEHFDFGQRLRDAVAGGPAAEALTGGQVELLRSVLARGALLTDEQFPIAAGLLRAFLAERDVRPAGPWVVLNGLPRHAGQAQAVEALVHVVAVLELRCTPHVVLARLRRDTGGDRAGRADDDEASVARKLAIYERRTAPLVDVYRRRGAAIVAVDVGETTSADDALAELMKETGPDKQAMRPGEK